MSVQIYSYNGFVRLVTDSSVLLLAKTQIKSIEAVRDDSVKISLGEGPLNEIVVKLSDVTMPSGLVDVAALRDAIAHMLDHANLYEDEALIKLQSQIDQLIEIKHLFNLWQGSLQVDLNFQQLQVNALVAINNRLLESKENDERLINQGHDQFTETKAQTLQLVSIGNGVESIKVSNQTALSNQEVQTTELRNIIAQIVSSNSYLTAVQGLMNTNLIKQDTLIAVLNEMKNSLTEISFYTQALTGEISTNTMMLVDIKAQNASMLLKADSQVTLLTGILNALNNGSTPVVIDDGN
ncbi:hypothetical protein [Niastella sp. OAS944]|uniref:hypothetical protein n=1 Tax=Niastella sp. OAS944 TaxID=2664089 RepID=UPI003492B600|nr:hypothetical protein [Chitinophagaceae bacterium OAS944]